MLIHADRFSTLPEGCPVLWGGRRWDSATVQLGGSIALRRQGRKGVDTRIVMPGQVQVDLTNPAAVRAFAPALIQNLIHADHPPAAVWDGFFRYYSLILCIYQTQEGVAVTRYAPDCVRVTGDTPEACLLAGLKAALDAACVAVGGAG